MSKFVYIRKVVYNMDLVRKVEVEGDTKIRIWFDADESGDIIEYKSKYSRDRALGELLPVLGCNCYDYIGEEHDPPSPEEPT